LLIRWQVLAARGVLGSQTPTPSEVAVAGLDLLRSGTRHTGDMVQPGPDPDSYPPIDPSEPVPDDPGELSPDTPETLPPPPVEPMPGPDDPDGVPEPV
jgi:hypothetical protein